MFPDDDFIQSERIQIEWFDLFKLNVLGFDVYLSEDLIWFSEAVGVNSRRSMFVLGVGGLLDLHKNSINQNAVFVIHIVMFQHG